MNDVPFLCSKLTLIEGRLPKIRLCYVMIILLIISKNAEFKIPSACDVFCNGQLLHVVQTANLNPDDKYFVDMKMKVPKSVIFSRYYTMMIDTGGKPSSAIVSRFVRRCFSEPGSEFARCKPKDWSANPKFVTNITDKALKQWALHLNKMWKILCRKIRNKVREKPDLYSVLLIPNLFFIPGGRHREYYYWDSYWIVLGLLHSEMYSTVKGIIENFLYLIEEYGFVPNGGRIYHLNRSNVPLLIPMVDIYYKRTNDVGFVRKHVKSLEKEFNFWMKNRTVEVPSGGKTFKLATYSTVQTTGPRPEAYKKDKKLAEFCKTEKEKENLFSEIKASCESGWNFSSRWFIKKNNTDEFCEMKTRSIIPVDLNAVLFLNAQILSEFFKIANDSSNAAKYKNISDTWKESVTKVFWSEKDGVWFDYDILTKQLVNTFYTSNTVPLWAGCYDKKQKDKIAENVVNYLIEKNVITFRGGVPVSLIKSGYHWDFPNAMPPSLHMLIVGLESTQNSKASKIAYDIAKLWIRANYIGYKKLTTMYDTYHATKPGQPGTGVVYKAQTGYGWTNGIILDLLNSYGKHINVHDLKNSALSMTSLLSITMIFFQVYIIYINDIFNLFCIYTA